MKIKITILIISIFLFIGIRTNASEDGRPQWTEYAPDGFLNPNVLTTDEMDAIASTRAREFANKFFYCRPTEKKYVNTIRKYMLMNWDCRTGYNIKKRNYYNALINENNENKYWLNKKLSFENELKACDSLSKNQKGSCYIQFRNLMEQRKLVEEQRQLIQAQQRANRINAYNGMVQDINQSNINFQLQQINNKLAY